MEQVKITNENTPQQEFAVESAVEAVEPEKTKTNTDTQVTNYNGNLLYEESLGFIPGTIRGRQDPRYVFAKFPKQYKNLTSPMKTCCRSWRRQIYCSTWSICRSPRPIKALISGSAQKMQPAFL